MKQLEAIIYVEPTPKGRPRVTVFGGLAHAYTPKKTRVAEADIKAAIRKEVMEHGSFDAGVPLSISVTFFRVRPAHLPKHVRYPVTRPDGTNYEALLCDSLQCFVFPNDSQIVDCHWRKRYALNGSPPRIELLIKEVE